MPLQLERIEDLFDAPTTSPFSVAYRPTSSASGMDTAAAVLAGARAHDVVLEIAVDRGPLPEDPELTAAVHRYAAARAAAVRLELRKNRRFGVLTALAGVGLLFVLLTASRLLADPTPEVTVGDLVSEGLQIAAWVSLWFPVEHALYGLWEDRRVRRVWDVLAAAVVRGQARRTTVPPGVSSTTQPSATSSSRS